MGNTDHAVHRHTGQSSALQDPDNGEVITFENITNAHTLQLPANLPEALAPGLQPLDRVIVTPLENRELPLNAPPIFFLLSEPKGAYAVGRVISQTSERVVLRYSDDGPSVAIRPSNVISAWAIRFIINRKVS